MTDTTTREAFGFVVQDFARAHRRVFEKQLQDAGLNVTLGMARVLAYIYHYPGLRQNQLAEGMGVEPMTMVGHLDALERAGLVERVRHTVDRRSKMTRITETGYDLIERLKEIGVRVRNTAGADFSLDELEALQDKLSAMRDRLNAELAKMPEDVKPYADRVDD